ncbi:phosphopantetheine-binding protein, partial [Streptosporangium sp. NPDC048865]|uniref:phosphopantetheine-binding protein n=1 Tax=Streptosporangium sp. NPDC048865 TaxID=3155766 RepID=UPI003449F701
PVLGAPPSERDPRAPRTAREELLARIFAEVLGSGPVGIDEGFFALGGDSLQVIRLIARAREEGLVLGLRDVFTLQTVAALAGAAGTGGADGGQADPPPSGRD